MPDEDDIFIPTPDGFDEDIDFDEDVDNTMQDNFRSNDSGQIVKSTRTFGVEFEVNAGNDARRYLEENVPRGFVLEHDGSVNNGIEVVSPILGGSKGESLIRSVCSVLNDAGTSADDSCGMHVHLGANDFYSKRDALVVTLGTALEMAENKKYASLKYTLVHANTLKELKPFYRGELYAQISQLRGMDGFFLDAWEDFTSGNYAGLIPVYIAGEKSLRRNFRIAATVGNRGLRIPTDYSLGDEKVKTYKGEPVITGDNVRFCVVDPKTSQDMFVIAERADDAESRSMQVSRLRRVAAFYSVFDDVIASMLPVDRRENDYSRRVDLHISLTDISRINTLLDFFTLWTKTNTLSAFRQSLREGRHESRYHGINFHALLKHGTIEIRYHAGTTDAEKTLHWVALHQKILDIAADLQDPRFDLSRLEKANMVIGIEQKANLFFRKLNLSADTEKYLRARIDEFKGGDEALVKSLLEDYNE